MVTSFARSVVTVVRPTLVSDHGSLVADWSSPSRHAVRRCLITPVPSQEIAEHRDLTLGARRVVMPPGSDVTAQDRLELPGVVGQFDVVGEPLEWPSPTGRLAHVEVLANRWTEGL